MNRHYKGYLGQFEYDDKEWKVYKGEASLFPALEYLHYERIKDGKEIVIPKGVRDCSLMFMGCTSLTL